MMNTLDKEALANLSSRQKKELLGRLLTSLLDDLSDTEKKALFQKIMNEGRQDKPVIEMVEH
jgi:hypothetical protein